MKAQLRPAFTLFLLLTLVTGVVYPLLVTLIAQAVFPHQANGSILRAGGVSPLSPLIGSELIGQHFEQPHYFWGRPSATDPVPTNAASSTGSNLGPTSPALLDAVRTRVETIRKAHPGQTGPIPADLVTASASGLDPHISPAAADYQVTRIARARALDETRIRTLVESNTEGRTFGLLGEPRVNVLKLNLALDATK